MITVIDACAIYTKREAQYAAEHGCEPAPIAAIHDSAHGWAIFPDDRGVPSGILIPVLNKHTGEIMIEEMFEYMHMPQVEVPEPYRQTR